MLNETNDLPPPVNHVFVDYENVHQVDPSIIGSKPVHLTLLLGPKKTKFDATVVEKLLRHAANVEFVRLQSSGDDAVDFALAYYLGRAVLADPGGYFHVVSQDGGYDPLIEHLRSKHVRARRHKDFTTLTFSAVSKSPAAPAPVATPAAKLAAKLLVSMPAPAEPTVKSPAKPKAQPSQLETMVARVLEHLRKPITKRPSTKKKLVSYLIAHLGKKLPGAEVLQLIEMMGQAGHLVSDDKGKLTYHLD
jgi:hypothetical protein